LTRVATRQTESAWIREARGKNVHQIEELVAGHRPGDNPEDPADPELRMHVVRLELTAAAYALFRQATAAMNDEYGRHLDDSELASALITRALAGARNGESNEGAKYQIALTVCSRCRQGYQDGAGATIPVDPATVERAECDAEHIGSLDAIIPARARRAIPPAVARLVRRRDHGRCRVPGCRSSRAIELHHIEHQANGGSHEPSNIVSICDSCHLAHHEGRLRISGTADRLVVERIGDLREQPRESTDGDPEARAHVGTADSRTAAAGRDDASTHAEATQALTCMGYKPREAREAIASACNELGEDLPLENLVFESLRRCRRASQHHHPS
jgi:hypothetical protein